MGRGNKDPNKPSGPLTPYACFVKVCREEHRKKHPNESIVFAEFSKKCAERWKTMNEKEKRRFVEMAEKDRARYDREMVNYKPPKGAKPIKRKHKKEPGQPKRALSAFFWFCQDERPKVRAESPELGVGDVAKELGRRWADTPDNVKQKFEAKAQKDKKRYEEEMKAWKAKKARAAAGATAEPEEEETGDFEEDEDSE